MKRHIKVNTLRKSLEAERRKGRTIGFVPTMGALHAGHISLISTALERSDIVVCSIFVNPTQFNDKDDLKKYPRTTKSDLALLQRNGCHYAFTPSVQEVYPSGMDKAVEVDLGGLDEELEGRHRPGHFDGVVQVVYRLLEIVQPHALFMGQKDFQQFTIIDRMISQLSLQTILVVCPILREEHGLAMSSRNERLPVENRRSASIIFETLQEAKEKLKTMAPPKVESWAMQALSIPDFKPEYFQIIDGNTLKTIESIKSSIYVVACVAVWTAGIRLIDNMVLLDNRPDLQLGYFEF